MKSTCLCLILVLVIAGFSYATIIRVPRDYPTIEEAIGAAVYGDIIWVTPGTYTGVSYLMLKSGVDLIGAGADVTFLNYEYGVKADGATNLTLQGFTISSHGNAISGMNGASLTIRDNVTEGAAGANGIECNDCGFVTIEYNTVGNVSNNGIRLANTPAIVRHNTIYSNGENGVECLNGANVSIYNNEIYKNGRSGVCVLVDAGTVDIGGGSLGSLGKNEIYDNALYAVYNYTSNTIKAENNWWGESPPASSLFYGEVDYTPWLTTPPFGSINGYVVDVDGNPLEKAIVISVNKDTKEKNKAVTDIEGYYEIKDLNPGIYWLICFKKQYKTGIQKVEVKPGEVIVCIFVLKPKVE